jgi:hypothetical protein
MLPEMANGHFLLNSKLSWGVGLIPSCWVTFCGLLPEGGGGGGELMKPDLLYILPHLKGTLYRFRIEQFGDIHCKITIKAMGGLHEILMTKIQAMQCKIK